jgi:hypothetical protein
VAATLPYAHHWRLARSPNETFLAGNTHREDISVLDDLQPVYAALYSDGETLHPVEKVTTTDLAMNKTRVQFDRFGGNFVRMSHWRPPFTTLKVPPIARVLKPITGLVATLNCSISR